MNLKRQLGKIVLLVANVQQALINTNSLYIYITSNNIKLLINKCREEKI